MKTVESLSCAAGCWNAGSQSWERVRVDIENGELALRPGGDPMGPRRRSWCLAEVVALDEIAPFDADPANCEVRLATGEAVQLVLSRDALAVLCDQLRVAPEMNPSSTERTRVRRPASQSRRLLTAAAAALVLVVGVSWGAGPAMTVQAESAARPTSESGSDTAGDVSSGAEPGVAAPAVVEDPGTAGAGRRAVPPPSSPGDSPPADDGLVIAPLTGLAVPASSLERAAIVSKIDASPEAMPQVGMEQADVVYEVMIEWGSRYIAVWHSRQPSVVGPHRSARTTDPDLLAMFGHPLFAFSGANPGVVQALALTTWKTGVGPGEVPAAYYRDLQRPWPHNLFAHTDVLRTRPAPLQPPTPIFEFHPPGSTPGGVPVDGVTAFPGLRSEFRWDPSLDGWRRRVWVREHLHATGEPVAPTNVVVLKTPYARSWADANSPEAISVGTGGAWVFTRGTVRHGSWTRATRTDPWNLRDAAGTPLTLSPGTTWVVLSSDAPEIRPSR